MHDLDPVFRDWSRSAKIAQLLQDLGFQQPLPVQSMLILKVALPLCALSRAPLCPTLT